MKHLHFNLFGLALAVLVLGFIASFIWGTDAAVVDVLGYVCGACFFAGVIVYVVGVIRRNKRK